MKSPIPVPNRFLTNEDFLSPAKIFFQLILSAIFFAILNGCGSGGSRAAPESSVPQVVFQGISGGDSTESLYLIDSSDMQLKKIVDLGRFFSSDKRFSVSPDKSHISYWAWDENTVPNVYSTHTSDIYGKNVHAIHASSMQPEYHWSPTGGELLYQGLEGSSIAAMLVSVPNGNTQRLNPSGQSLESFAWSSNGRYFVYALRSQGMPSELWLRDRSSGTVVQIFSASDFLYQVFVSSNGKFVVANTSAIVDKLHIVSVNTGEVTTQDNVFLYDFDWLPEKNSAYYINGHTNTLNRLDLDVFSVKPVLRADASDVTADEVFISPGGGKLFFNSYGQSTNSLGVVRTLDDHVLYSRTLAPDFYPIGLAAWNPSGEKVAVPIVDAATGNSTVSIIDSNTISAVNAKKQDGSEQFHAVEKIVWLNDATLALEASLPSAIYVGEVTGNGVAQIGVTATGGGYDYLFDSSSTGSALFYLTRSPQSNEQPGPYGVAFPVVYDVKNNTSHILRAVDGGQIHADFFQIVK